MKTTDKTNTFTHIRARNFAAILVSLLAAIIMIPGLSTYLPLGLTDRIGIPIFLFPFIWVALFLYSYMAKSVLRVWLLLGGIILSHALLSFLALQ